MKHFRLLILLILLTPLYGLSQNMYTVSGYLTDSYTEKALDGINISVLNNDTGTITDYTGFYILYLTSGKYKISYSAKGYVAVVYEVNLNKDVELDVVLEAIEKDSRDKRHIFAEHFTKHDDVLAKK